MHLPPVVLIFTCREGKVTPTELIDVAAKRIAETDGEVNAVPIHCYERALARAKLLEVQGHPSHKDQPGYLWGLPILVKDLNSVEGVLYTKGAPHRATTIGESSDSFVRALEYNGAIVMGKTNTPEFGAGSQSFNSLFGTTATPFDCRMTSGGSSGGAAASLAAGSAWLATGSDLGGSLRIPASFCGIVGFSTKSYKDDDF